MQMQIPLIQKKKLNSSTQYQVCKEGIAFLRTLKTKKVESLAYSFVLSKKSLSQFNSYLFSLNSRSQNAIRQNVCLTIFREIRQLDDQRVVLIFTAYQQPRTSPFMVLLGYLASSLFIYHHANPFLSLDSDMTDFLGRLKQLLVSTDIDNLNREISEKKGYSKSPYFLCLLPAVGTNKDSLKQFYRYAQGNEQLNNSVDALIDYLPQRSSISLSFTKEQIAKIGSQFQECLLGRQLFNYQFTGSSIQNLCFECCQTFNKSESLNLALVFNKIIQNQKARLEDSAFELYLTKISETFFGGNKIDYDNCSSLPLASGELLMKHNKIVDQILDETLMLASYCMNLNEYKKIQRSLTSRFYQQYLDLSSANQIKTDKLCGECFHLLENLQENVPSSEGMNEMFRQLNNKLQLFSNETCELLGNDNDHTLRTLSSYQFRLQSKLVKTLQNSAISALQNLQLKIQQYRVEKEDLKYSLKVSQNKLRKLQYQYNLQGDILNQYKLKLMQEPEHTVSPCYYSTEVNKLRKRVQQLQEESKDKALFIEELETVIERFEGLTQKQRSKFKFSKQIAQMIKEVSIKINSCYSLTNQVKDTTECYEQLKTAFAKQRLTISEQRRKSVLQANLKEAQLQKIVKQKNILEEVVHEARQSIQVYKHVSDQQKESISDLESKYTQALCSLAETESRLQSFMKVISLLADQPKGRAQSLLKFYKVSTDQELKKLLLPFLKKNN